MGHIVLTNKLVFCAFLNLVDLSDDEKMEDAEEESKMEDTDAEGGPKEEPKPPKTPSASEEEQISARIAGAVALVAANMSVTTSAVLNMIDVMEAHEYSLASNTELAKVIEIGYLRNVAVRNHLNEVSKKVPVGLGPFVVNSLTDPINWFTLHV